MSWSGAWAVELGRSPVEMATTTVTFQFAASHETGSSSARIDGFPQFDKRLGSFDRVLVESSTSYDVVSSSWMISAPAAAGYGSYDTALAINLGDWLTDSTSGLPIPGVTQEVGAYVQCSPCTPGTGILGSYSAPETTSQTFQAQTPLASGFDITGTSVSLTASTTNASHGLRVMADYRWSGEIALTPTYWAHTTRQYLDNAVSRANSGGGWYERSEAVAGELVSLRSLNAATSSKNEALRSAEYAITSFWAAQQYVLTPSFETLVGFWMQGPFGVAGHNSLKTCKEVSPTCAAILDRIQDRKPTDLPGTSPGGTIGSGIAWIHGTVAPDDIDGLGLAVESGTTAIMSPTQAFAVGGVRGLFGFFGLDARGGGALQRLPKLEPKMNLNRLQSGAQETPGVESFMALAAGNAMTAMALPDIEGEQHIASFSLVVSGAIYVLGGGVVHDLVALTGGAVDGFVVTAIQGVYGIHGPAIDVAFANAGGVDLMQMSMTPVPELPSRVLLAAGLAIAAATARWRLKEG